MQNGNVRSADWVADKRSCSTDPEESRRLSAVCVGRQQQWDQFYLLSNLQFVHLFIVHYILFCSPLPLFMLHTLMFFCWTVFHLSTGSSFPHFSSFHTESGQTLAQTSGCLDVLLELFRYYSVREPLPCADVVYSVYQLVFLAGLLFPCPQWLLVGVPTLIRSINSGHQCPVLSVGASTTLRMVL